MEDEKSANGNKADLSPAPSREGTEVSLPSHHEPSRHANFLGASAHIITGRANRGDALGSKYLKSHLTLLLPFFGLQLSSVRGIVRSCGERQAFCDM